MIGVSLSEVITPATTDFLSCRDAAAGVKRIFVDTENGNDAAWMSRCSVRNIRPALLSADAAAGREKSDADVVREIRGRLLMSCGLHSGRLPCVVRVAIGLLR